MKKQLNIQRAGSEGFFLPYTIFISMLVILNLTAMIVLYENKANTNKTMNELVETETLIQMTKAKFVNGKVYDSSESGEVNYEHPNGQVNLSFEWLDDRTVQTTMFIETNKGTNIQRGFKLYFSDTDFDNEGITEYV